MNDMRIYKSWKIWEYINHERYENVKSWKIWECKNYEWYENVKLWMIWECQIMNDMRM